MSNTNFKGGYRDGTISLEEAKKVFNDYYDKRAKSKIGQFRAKLFDMMYQKKDKFTLTPDEKGSERYKLQEGPRTFDMKGVDWFPEGTTFQVEKEGKEYTSKGATNRRANDTNNEIYGPRIKDDSTLYSEHFADKYQERVISDEFGYNEEGKSKNLIDIYWQKYRDEPSKYMRKNKKDRLDILTIDFASYSEIPTKYRISSLNTELLTNLENEDIIMLDNEDLNESTVYFLFKLKFLNRDSDGNYTIDKRRASLKYIRVFTDSSYADDIEDGIEFNVETGYLIDQNCNDTSNTFYEFFGAEHDLDDIIKVEAVECPDTDKDLIEGPARLNVANVGFEFGNPLSRQSDSSDASSSQSVQDLDKESDINEVESFESDESVSPRSRDESLTSPVVESEPLVDRTSSPSKAEDETQSLSDVVPPKVDLSDINIKSTASSQRASELGSISSKPKESDETPIVRQVVPKLTPISDKSRESDGTPETPQSRASSVSGIQEAESRKSLISNVSSDQSEITVDSTDSQTDEQRDEAEDLLAALDNIEFEEVEEEEEDTSSAKAKELDEIYQALPDDVRSIDDMRSEMENLDLN